MLKRNFIFLMITMAMMNIFCQNCKAISNIPNPEINTEVLAKADSFTEIQTDRIKKVTFRERLKKTPEAQINSFYKKYNKYSTKNDIEKLKELYDDDFINNDGFDKNIIFKMTQEASDSYKNVKYNTVVNNISITDNTAVVEIKEITTGETTKKIDKLNDNGAIKSEIYYIDYLKKDGADWKITNTIVLSEKLELKYGEAKNIDITINAPNCVSAGASYDVDVDIDLKSAEGIFMVGSIVNEPIVYPQEQKKDKYHALKKDSIARVMKANTDGHNEYSTATLAITRAQVEPNSVVINMTGMAFIMKRVNVLPRNQKAKIE